MGCQQAVRAVILVKNRPRGNTEVAMGRGMVDISGKPVVFRKATAAGKITLRPETIEAVRKGEIR